MPVTPQGIPVKQGDQIQLTGNGIGGQTYAATIHVVDLDGNELIPIILVQTVSTDRTGKNTTFTVTSPMRIVSAGVTIITGTAPVGPGETFLQLHVFNGQGAGPSNQRAVTLFSGYFYPGHTPSFPVGPIEGSQTGPGRRYTAAGTDPAAGSEVADTVPSKALWRLIGIEVVLVTDATVANRNTNFFADDAGSTVTRSFVATDATNQTATQTRTHAWYEGNDTPTTASVSVSDTVTLLAKYPTNLPLKYLLIPGSNLRTVTTGIVAGDNYGAPRYVVEEYIQT